MIRNIVIDIIKPEEFYDLIKKGNIEHKDDVIQVQLNVLTYCAHTFNYRCLVPDKDRKLIFRETSYCKLKENKIMC